MVGLCAARVLADRFDQVMVIDRDELPATPEWRREVAQARHVHLLLGDDAQPLEQRFPAINLRQPGVRARRAFRARPRLLARLPPSGLGAMPTSICAQIGDVSTARLRVHFRVICHATAWRLPDV